MPFSPREIDVLVALVELHKSGHRDISYETMARKVGITVINTRKIITGVRDEIIKKSHRQGRTFLRLNPDLIVTTGLVARILIKLREATASTHVKTDLFKK